MKLLSAAYEGSFQDQPSTVLPLVENAQSFHCWKHTKPVYIEKSNSLETMCACAHLHWEGKR